MKERTRRAENVGCRPGVYWPLAATQASRNTSLFRLVAAGFALAALYHIAALSSPGFAKMAYSPMYPTLRHVTFVVVDSLGAVLFLRRPRWLIWPYLVLTLQVLQGHGVRGWQTLVREHRINWVDAITVSCVLLGLILLLIERTQREL